MAFDTASPRCLLSRHFLIPPLLNATSARVGHPSRADTLGWSIPRRHLRKWLFLRSRSLRRQGLGVAPQHRRQEKASG